MPQAERHEIDPLTDTQSSIQTARDSIAAKKAFKRFITGKLREESTPRKVELTVSDIIEAQYWRSRGIAPKGKDGKPDLGIHMAKALAKAVRRGFSDLEITDILARIEAFHEEYCGHRILGGVAAEEPLIKARQQAERQKRERIIELRAKYNTNFQKLMELPNDRFLTHCANHRIDLLKDYVYENSGPKARRIIRERKADEETTVVL